MAKDNKLTPVACPICFGDRGLFDFEAGGEWRKCATCQGEGTVLPNNVLCECGQSSNYIRDHIYYCGRDACFKFKQRRLEAMRIAKQQGIVVQDIKRICGGVECDPYQMA